MPKPSLTLLKNPRESFSSRIFFLFTIFIIIISVSFTSFFFQQQRKSLKDSLTNEGELLAKLLAHNATLGVFAENEALLTAPVNGIMQSREVLFVSIQTLEGKLLKEQSRKPLAKGPGGVESTVRADVEKLKNIQKPYAIEDSEVFEFWAPVISSSSYPTEEALLIDETPFHSKDRTIGLVQIILDKKYLNKRLQALLLTSVFMAMLFLVVGSIITYLIVQGITQPLNRLTEGVKALGNDGASNAIVVETRDEIGNLANAFNSMSEAIKKREHEKQHLEEQLRHSQKMEAIGTLAGGVAHDFNNLLTAIIGFGTLLQLNLQEDEQLAGYADQILAASDRAAALTKRLLAFSRKQIIKPSPMELNTIIRNLEKLLTRVISEDVEFSIKLSEENLFVMTDAGLMDQVIINLVTNARDAMPGGGNLKIETSIAGQDESPLLIEGHKMIGKYALITVTDTGIGMNEEIMGRIFDPFFTTKEIGKGTGLGLSMAYGIIKQLEGFISVESAPGQGTTTRIYLPLIDSQEEQVKPEILAFPRGNYETVLLAEDDKQIMRLTKEILETHRYNIIEAADGEEAIAKFKENADKIELVLLDVIMPKKNGKEAFDEIKQIKPGVRTLFFSGYTFDIINSKGVLEEEVNFISKPVQPGELLQKIRDVLQN